MSKLRDEEGRYRPTIDDRDVLFFFDSGQRDFYSASEVADQFDIDRSQAHRRLSQLADDGELSRVEVGNRNVVWWRPRDVAVMLDEDGGYSIIDPLTGVASQGETRPEALRMLAEALEAYDGQSAVDPDEILNDLDLARSDIDESASPPWE